MAQRSIEKEGANQNSPRLSSFNYLTYLSHPEQEAQQSAEAQHAAVVAAFTAPARPIATTVINTIARMFFMDFSPLKNQNWFLSTNGNAISVRLSRQTSGS
jgi:hypothetical protein